jgi:hypothetical protein
MEETKNTPKKDAAMSFSQADFDAEENLYKDRRTFARFKAEIVLRCLENDNESGGITIDISAQGLGVLASEGFRPDVQVEVRLRFPSTKEEFVTTGTIVWCRQVDKQKFRVGVYLEKPELMMISQLLNGCSNGNHANQ